MSNQNNLFCHSVLLFREDSLHNYLCKGKPSRFHLKDNIILGRLTTNIEHISEQNLEDSGLFENNQKEQRCKKSFNLGAIKPLHWDTFDLVQEYCLSIPLPVQILLECFINRHTIHNCKDIKATIDGKLTLIFHI